MKLLRKEKEKDFFAFSEQNYFWSQFKSELRESMKTQKEEIEVLEKQKESTQGLACELERQNENQNDEIERTEVREKAAKEKSNFFYSGETDYKGRYNDKVIRQKQSKAQQKDSALCEAKARGAEMRQKSLFKIGFQAESKT